jgi:hypothetical protein
MSNVKNDQKQVKLSKQDLSAAKSGNFVPWNCPFDECGMPGSPAKKS